MQPEYLARLSTPLQKFIHEVEEEGRVSIQVVPTPRLNKSGPAGQGNLEAEIRANRILLFAPTNGYFPDGAVRHEVLHVKRFHVEGVPKLTLAEGEAWDRDFAESLGALDNAMEHIVIVPLELQFHPERREHWEAVMSGVWSDLPFAPVEELPLATSLHWTFLRHVLPNSPQLASARYFMNEHALLGKADAFVDQFLAVAARKEEMVRVLFLTFPEIPRRRAALEFVNSVIGTRQTPIP